MKRSIFILLALSMMMYSCSSGETSTTEEANEASTEETMTEEEVEEVETVTETLVEETEAMTEEVEELGNDVDSLLSDI